MFVVKWAFISAKAASTSLPWVNRVGLTMCRLLLVFRYEQTSAAPVGMSRRCAQATLPLTRIDTRSADGRLGGNTLPIQKIDLVEGPTRLIEEQHQPQPIGQIGFACEIHSWIGYGRDAHATYEAKA